MLQAAHAACEIVSNAHGEAATSHSQVAALEMLVRVASGPDAGLLGSSWVTILRCLSLLEALQVQLAGTSVDLECPQSGLLKQRVG